MSSGAKQAGLSVKWGQDKDVPASRTYRKNFPGAICEVIPIDLFIHCDPEPYHVVDILHASPPCQSFSPLQTRPGPDAEEKQAPIFAMDDLIKKCRPRIITMEETFGLDFPENKLYLAMVVRTLTDNGYSVRWKIMNFLQYGAPQARNRLMLIAAR